MNTAVESPDGADRTRPVGRPADGEQRLEDQSVA